MKANKSHFVYFHPVNLIIMIMVLLMYNTVYAQDQEVLLNTMDFSRGGSSKTVPTLTLTKSYKIIYIAAYHNDIFYKPNPTVGLGLLNSKGEKICGGEAMPESGFNVEGGIMSVKVGCVLSSGTYTVWDEDPPTWWMNSSGYYQVKIVGIPQ